MKEIIKKIVVWILTLEARAVLKRYKPKIVAITGNMGKTSAKEAIYTAMSASRFVRKSEKNLNNEFGVPLTILGRESGWGDPLRWFGNIVEGFLLIVLKNHYPNWLILEVGADRPGDIKRIGSWLSPDISVITGVSDVPVHIEYFNSPEEVAAEKKELAHALVDDGTLVLNADDRRVYAMRESFRAKCITYGFNEKSDVTASHVEVEYGKNGPIGMRFRVNYDGSSIPFRISGALGKTHIYPVLAACATSAALGIDLVSVEAAFANYTPIAGRMRILKGVENSTIIDDTYNASPAAMYAALDSLEEIKVEGRKIVVVGDMLELGKYSVEEHRKVGLRIAEVADLVVVVGIRARGIAQAAIDFGFPEERARFYKQGESRKAGRDVAEALQSGDVVLVKGSQGMRMEKASEEVLADRASAKDVLVRQDDAWKRR